MDHSNDLEHRTKMDNNVNDLVYKRWLLCPIVGEITKFNSDYLKVNMSDDSKSSIEGCVEIETHKENKKTYNIIVICEPICRRTLITCHVYNDSYYDRFQIEPEYIGPTKIVINVPKTGTYKLIWYQNLFEKKFMDNMVEIKAKKQLTTGYIPDDDYIYRHEVVVKEQPDRIVFVSCDLLEADTEPKHSMWTRMYDEIYEDEQTCIIHLGDQAYMDKVFKDSVKLVNKYGMSDITSNQILKAFGKRYCSTLRPHNLILSTTTNYNLWDDHELRNNMTLNTNNLTVEEEYVRNLAVISYVRYQKALQLDRISILSPFSWHKHFNNVIILAVERTSRNITPDEILNAINVLTTNLSIKRLILCFSSAPIPPPTGLYGDIYRTITGDENTLETSKFWPSEYLYELYAGLFSWLQLYDDREVLVVGGDLHFGVHGIVRQAEKQFPVVISSPITNQPTTDRWIAAKGMPDIYQVSPANKSNYEPITFKTISSKARRCYAVVDVNASPMTVTMKYSKEKFPDHPGKCLSTLLQLH